MTDESTDSALAPPTPPAAPTFIQRLTVIGGFLAIAVAVTFAQDPAMFMQGIQIHRDRLLLGNGINIVSWGSSTGAFASTLTWTTPTAARTVTVPDQSGTIMLSGGTSPTSMRSGVGSIGTNPSSIVTGLSALTACSVSPRMTTGPYLVSSPPFFFTTQLTATPGQLDVYHWTTLGASSAGVEFTYICTGTP